MEYFEALADTLHFGRAAEMVGVTQPALSSQIAEMELRLGCRLFDRSGKTVHLTDEARAMRMRIEHILSEVREIEATPRRGRAAMEGRFRLGVIPTVAPYMLPSLLPALKRSYPGLTLELREAVTATLIDETAAGRLDGMIAALPLDHSALAVQPLFEDRFFLAVPASDPGFVSPPVAPESPALERLMLLEEGHCMREQALAVCGQVRPTAMSNYGATSLTTLLQMVAHGQGVTLIPEMARQSSEVIPDLRVVPFAEPMPSRMLGFAWRKNAVRRSECRALAETIRDLANSGRQQVHREQDPHHHKSDEADRKSRLTIADTV